MLTFIFRSGVFMFPDQKTFFSGWFTDYKWLGDKRLLLMPIFQGFTFTIVWNGAEEIAGQARNDEVGVRR